MGGSVCVVGALEVHMVLHAARFASPGETVRGATFATHPGGRGASHAVAASRLGARAALVGAVGADAWGGDLRALLAAEGVDIEHVARTAGAPTGVGVVTMLASGESATVVACGANLELTPEHVEAARSAIAAADALILANDLSDAANLRAAEIAKRAGRRVVLHATPARDVAPELLARVDLLVLGHAEARALARCDASEGVMPAGTARRLAARGPSLVAITLGAEGAVLFDGETVLQAPAPAVAAVDAVGAGEAFVAALVVAQHGGARLADALRFACAAGGLAAAAEGSVEPMPTKARVEELLGAARARS